MHVLTMCHKELLYCISDNSSLIGERGITMVKSTFTNLPTAKRQKLKQYCWKNSAPIL